MFRLPLMFLYGALVVQACWTWHRQPTPAHAAHALLCASVFCFLVLLLRRPPRENP